MPSRFIHTNFPEIWKFRYMEFGVCICSHFMESYLKWVQMARYELIVRLDGVLWLRIILKPLLTPKRSIKTPQIQKMS